MDTTRRLLEKDMRDFLFDNPSALNVKWVAKEFPINPVPWLGAESRPPTWDLYVQGTKKMDLVGVTTTGELVLCELKVRGGAGDNAPYQVLDYYSMLSGDQKAQHLLAERAGCRAFEDLAAIVVYIVVAGHISQLLRRRIQNCVRLEPLLFTLFQAIPPQHTKDGQWSFERIAL